MCNLLFQRNKKKRRKMRNRKRKGRKKRKKQSQMNKRKSDVLRSTKSITSVIPSSPSSIDDVDVSLINCLFTSICDMVSVVDVPYSHRQSVWTQSTILNMLKVSIVCGFRKWKLLINFIQTLHQQVENNKCEINSTEIKWWKFWSWC